MRPKWAKYLIWAVADINKMATNNYKDLYPAKTAQCAHFDSTRPSLAFPRAENQFQ